MLPRLIVRHCDCGLAKWWGQQEFAIPQNVLEIVYGQTICWIGTFYCPLLPAICTIKYFFMFYIKKVIFDSVNLLWVFSKICNCKNLPPCSQLSLINNCRPATRPFRASSSNFFFLCVLLIGLALACMPVIASVAQWVQTIIKIEISQNVCKFFFPCRNTNPFKYELIFLFAQNKLLSGLWTICELHHLLGGCANCSVPASWWSPGSALGPIFRGFCCVLLCCHLVCFSLLRPCPPFVDRNIVSSIVIICKLNFN